MNHILILNFGKSNEVITSAHAIAAYQDENPSAEISVLTYTENLEYYQVIENIKQVYTIDRELIRNIIDNPLYSDAFAINSFMQTIEEVSMIPWHKTINYSNDKVSSYLIKAIDSQEEIGTFVHQNGSVGTSSDWATYQNYVAAKQTRATIPRAIIRHNLMGVSFNKDANKIKIDPDYALIAGQNFSRIRQSKGSASTVIVGISLEAGYDGHVLDTKTLTGIIETLEDSINLKPVLLLSNKQYQKDIANELNKSFNNSLISINVDTIATSSVVSNLDLLISPANDQLAIADALETKCIEIRDANSNQAPSVLTTGSYIIYQLNDSHIEDDLTLIINEEFSNHLPINKAGSPTKVYKCVEDQNSSFYTQIRGSINIQSELRYHIERATHFQILGSAITPNFIKHIRENTDKNEIEVFASQTKDELTGAVKILLATLRSLKAVKGSQKNLNQFISYLDSLIRMGDDDTIVGSILSFFEGKIENIQGADLSENIKCIESELFELKSNLQSFTNTISELISTDKETSVSGTNRTEYSL